MDKDLKDLDREINELEAFLLEVEKKELAVPKDLESRIIDRGKKLKGPLPPFVKVLAGMAAALLIFFSIALTIPQFAAYASNIPGIGTILDWIRGDSGIEYARGHGYNLINGVVVQRDGCTIYIDNIFMDENRLSLTVAIDGPLIKGIRDRTGDGEAYIQVGSELGNDLGYSDNWYKQHPTDEQDKSDSLAFIRWERNFQDDSVKKFLDKDPQYIDLQISILNNDEFDETIKIPFSKVNILMSKVYDLNMQRQFKLNGPIDDFTIDLKSLTVSPSRLQLDTNIIMPKGFSFSGFEGGRLVGEEGKVYAAEGLVSAGTTFYFVPSVYFDLPSRLTFQYDGIRVAKEDSNFILRMDEPLPKTVEYMGVDIKIRSVEYIDDELRIVAEFPDSETLSIQNINTEGSSSVGWSQLPNHDNTLAIQQYSIEVEQRDEYEIYFFAAGYLIDEPGEILIPLE
ncbi:MAG TPA: DUF4179 domain-containing protein [Bacillota bacterium]|nr:DUF4179 domain-containing protein [Bacillota bacterium]